MLSDGQIKRLAVQLDLLQLADSRHGSAEKFRAFARACYAEGQLDAQQRIAELEAEVREQARLLGISGSTEARLLARVAELERALDVATFHRDAYTAELARCREENAAMHKEGGE